MFIELTPEQRDLEIELRKYFSELLSPAEREELKADRHGRPFKEIVKRMGRDGWLGVGWPTPTASDATL